MFDEWFFHSLFVGCYFEVLEETGIDRNTENIDSDETNNRIQCDLQFFFQKCIAEGDASNNCQWYEKAEHDEPGIDIGVASAGEDGMRSIKRLKSVP